MSAELFIFNLFEVVLDEGLIPGEFGIGFILDETLAGVLAAGSERFGSLLIEIGADFGDLGEALFGEFVVDVPEPSSLTGSSSLWVRSCCRASISSSREASSALRTAATSASSAAAACRPLFAFFVLSEIMTHSHADLLESFFADAWDLLQLLGRHVGKGLHGGDPGGNKLLDDGFAQFGYLLDGGGR